MSLSAATVPAESVTIDLVSVVIRSPRGHRHIIVFMEPHYQAGQRYFNEISILRGSYDALL